MRIKKLTYLPVKVNISELHDNLKLYTDKEIQGFKRHYRKDGKYGHVYVIGGQYFGIGKGLRHETEEAKCTLNWERILGLGQMGVVKLAQNLDTGEWVAWKIQDPILNADHSLTAAKELRSLYRLGKTINHNKTGKPLAQIRHSTSKGKDRHQMPIKLARGVELYEVASRGRELACIEWINIAINILLVVKQLHQRGVLHRDIKLENMLYDPVSGKVELIDMGFAQVMDVNHEVRAAHPLGSLGYVAPELLVMDSVCIYNESTEVYALGASLGKLFELLYDDQTAKVLSDANSLIVAKTALPEEYRRNTRLPNPVIRDEVNDFIAAMMAKPEEGKPAKRKTVDEAIAFFNSIKKKLTPQERILRAGLVDAEEFANVLKHGSEEEINAWYEKLSSMHKVWLLDNKNKTERYYLELRQCLEKRGVVVGRRLFYGERFSTLNAEVMAEFVKHNNERVYEFTCFHAGRMSTVLAPQIQSQKFRDRISVPPPIPAAPVILMADEHYKSFKTAMDFEIIRLKNKYEKDGSLPRSVQKRIDAITAVLNEVYMSGGAITYEEVYKKVRSLRDLHYGKEIGEALKRQGMFGLYRGRQVTMQATTGHIMSYK